MVKTQIHKRTPWLGNGELSIDISSYSGYLSNSKQTKLFRDRPCIKLKKLEMEKSNILE